MAFLKIKSFGGNLAAIKFGVSRPPVYAVYDRRIYWRRQILANTRNSPNSPNIIARQNLLIYSTHMHPQSHTPLSPPRPPPPPPHTHHHTSYMVAKGETEKYSMFSSLSSGNGHGWFRYSVL